MYTIQQKRISEVEVQTCVVLNSEGVRKTGYSKAEGTKTGTSCAVVEIDGEGGLALTDRLGLDLALYSMRRSEVKTFLLEDLTLQLVNVQGNKCSRSNASFIRTSHLLATETLQKNLAPWGYRLILDRNHQIVITPSIRNDAGAK
ncbi:hypothetical protein B0H14DRAFT_2579352 [Mycena olivaceomarginata]|nr:hypothetical protein B0H14DRAFT_2579352 [Mycena olivaceomarginata]